MNTRIESFDRILSRDSPGASGHVRRDSARGRVAPSTTSHLRLSAEVRGRRQTKVRGHRTDSRHATHGHGTLLT